MKNALNILIISLLGLTSLYGQTLDKKYVDNWILSTFPELEIDSNVLYILNGIPIHPDSVDIEFGKFKQSDLIQITSIGKSQLDSLTFCRPYNSIVLLKTKGMQSKKSIRQNFTKAKNRYSKIDLKTTGDINIEKGEPVLIINGKQVFHTECYFEINKIKVFRIIGINYIDKPVSQNYYGANGMNGLIEIKTK